MCIFEAENLKTSIEKQALLLPDEGLKILKARLIANCLEQGTAILPCQQNNHPTREDLLAEINLVLPVSDHLTLLESWLFIKNFLFGLHQQIFNAMPIYPD